VTGFNWKFYWVGKTDLDPMPVPEELDYDMWLALLNTNPITLIGSTALSGDTGIMMAEVLATWASTTLTPCNIF